MNLAAVKHIPKSNMAYAFDESHIHLFLQVAKQDVEKVELIIGDPFEWKIVDGKYIWNARQFPRQTMEKVYETDLFDHFYIETGTTSTRSKYAFLIYSKGQTYFYGCRDLKKIVDLTSDANLYDLMGYFNYPYINKEDLMDSPKWIDDTVWYQIFLDRFNISEQQKPGFLPFGSITENIKNNQFFGGDLQGVIEKIPYLKHLGISGIYFTPIFKAYSAHKYDTEDYFAIDPSFGTNEDFRRMVEACHHAGIKVMLDAVFNHCGWDHPFFQDVIKNKRNSIYWDCFYIEDENFIDFPLDQQGRPLKHNHVPKYKTFAYTPFMPKLKTSNPVMEKYLLDVAKYWIEEFDIDGWRLDVSNEVSHTFWRKFRQVVRHAKPDVYIIGENWDDSTPWLRGDQFDAVMNYEISYPLWQFFAIKKNPKPISAEEFMFRINDLMVSYPKNIAINMFNLVSSHDTMRILSRCENNPDLVKLIYLFIFSFCGSPVIYYGDEIGMEGGDDPDCRRCMIWDESLQNLDLFLFFKRLIEIRHQESDMKNVDLIWHRAYDNILIYQKKSIWIIINNNAIEKTIELPPLFRNHALTNLETGQVLSLHSSLIVPKHGYFILRMNLLR
jgi:cyclomaltodextrinase / maltogenic alpha-amylase / neopullulanase